MKVKRNVAMKMSKWLMGLSIGLAVMNLQVFSMSAKAADTFIVDDIQYEVVGERSVKVDECLDLDFTGTMEIPETVENDNVKYDVVGINSYAFNYASANCVIIPNSITTIGTYAFYDCDNLVSVVIPDSVTSIGHHAFQDCKSLKRVTLSKNMTKIDSGVFSSCSSLSEIEIPEGVTQIGISAFSVCKQLKSVKLPSTVTKIDVSAFWYNESLETITIPANVTEIGVNAFYTCNMTKGLYFEGKVAEFGKNSFGGNFRCSKIVVPDEYLNYYKEQDVFSMVSGKIICVTCDSGKHVLKANGNGTTHSCDLCGKSENHDYTKQPYITSDAGKHYQICKVCKAQSKHVACTPGTAVKEKVVAATCGTNGSHNDVIYCSVCKQKLSTTAVVDPATGIHKWGATWLKNEKNHFKECGVCGKRGNGAAHADTNKDGKCDTCSYNMHVHVGSLVAKVRATSTQDGVKAYYKCSCGKYYLDAACTKAIADLAAWKAGSGKIYAATNITLSTTAYAYDGKVKKPAVRVKDSKGNTIADTNYSVAYSDGRMDVGKYTVKITFKGDYRGTKSLSFVINPKATTISSITPGTKSFTVKWAKRTTQVDGYQVQYATNEKFTANLETVTISKNNVVSKKIEELQAKKNYYVRVRTYKKVDNKNYYSAWTQTSIVKTK